MDMDNIDINEEELICEPDPDAEYDQQKLDEALAAEGSITATELIDENEAFALHDAVAELRDEQPVQTLEPAVESPASPPLVLQKVVVTFSNGRVGEFMGNAIMTVEEFRNAKGSFRPTFIDFTEPVVVKAEE